jgi:hypothetical protein
MKNKIKLPFTNEKKRGGKSFKIINEDQIGYPKKDIYNIIKNIFNSNSSNKINYIKGSNTKEYYNKINNN